MKFIQKLCFLGEAKNAIEVYEHAFGCTIKSMLHYSDAVANGWEQPDQEKDSLIYHAEMMFGEQEVRLSDLCELGEVEITRKVMHVVGFDTVEEVETAFSVLAEGGEIIRPLESPPFMIIIGAVKDRFGVQWELICDF